MMPYPFRASLFAALLLALASCGGGDTTAEGDELSEGGEDDRRSGSIILLDSNMVEKARWNFFEAWPCRYEAPEFDAAENTISVETLELCVERVERVDSLEN